jgi:hypothetical protein
MHAGGRCHAYNVRGKGSGRQINQVGALGKSDGPPGSPMDRDGTIWVSAANRLCRLLSVEMPLTEGGSPAADWQKGNVDLADLFEPKTRACVSRIPAPV